MKFKSVAKKLNAAHMKSKQHNHHYYKRLSYLA